MRYLLAALILVALALPARAQTGEHAHPDLPAQADLDAVAATAQQALDGTTVLGSNQVSIQQRVADLEAMVATQAQALIDQANMIAGIEVGGRAPHGIYLLNELPYGPGKTCTMTLADATVDCPPNITDAEGDDIDVAISCTSGSHDGTTYTAVEASPAGDPHRCHFMAADPRWGYATHNSVVTITVTP